MQNRKQGQIICDKLSRNLTKPRWKKQQKKANTYCNVYSNVILCLWIKMDHDNNSFQNP